MAAERSGFKVALIAGPTASGKSPLAMALAERRGGIVINADAMQVYRELRVLTARPTEAEEARVPHALYGMVPVMESHSVARWRVGALQAIEEARAAGRLPILVGGTGFYLKALVEGLVEIPLVPEDMRAEVRRRAAALSPRALHAEIARRDPAAAVRLAPGDRQRLTRAWEVHEATGQPLSEWQRATAVGAPYRFESVLVLPPRATLHAAADARFARMLMDGALEEAGALKGVDPTLPAMKAVGLRELIAHLDGRMTRVRAIEAAQFATHRYIKRQTTWFRHQMRFDHVFESAGEAAAALE